MMPKEPIELYFPEPSFPDFPLPTDGDEDEDCLCMN
jgi:hypothetical protein